MKRKISVILLFTMLLIISACGKGTGQSDNGEVTVNFGAQSYLDPQITSEIVKELIEDQTKHKVKITKDIQATPQIIQSMEQEELDMALFYSSEVYHDYFDEDEYEFTNEPEKTLKQAQELFGEHYDFKWYDSIGFSNDYALAVDEDWAEKNNIKTFSDLEPYADKMVIGADSSWVHRENDGYQGFKDEYFGFKDVKSMEVSIMFEAMENNDVDVILAYTVEPRLKKGNLRVLEDDKHFFPPYTASLVVRKALLEENPEIEEVLSGLVDAISQEDMTDIMYQVRFENESQGDAAHNWLKDKGLLEDNDS